jgi:hypothetical protein
MDILPCPLNTFIMKNLLFLCIGLAAGTTLNAQYAITPGNSLPFSINGTPYEIVMDNQTWANAAACAVARGGKLAEINSQEEQDSLFYYVNLANIDPANTIAPDGANSSYIWLGGNDISAEGTWVWDGDNDGNTTPFWQGTASGSPINGRFNNWGFEPDNFAQIQHALVMAIINFPNGPAGTWNDVAPSNTLYYVIEFNSTAGIQEEVKPDFSVFPNPFSEQLTIQRTNETANASYVLSDQSGRTVSSGMLPAAVSNIALGALPAGSYFLCIEGQAGQRMVVKN